MFVVNSSTEKVIHVWRWDDAPQEYQQLSRHGGDEDWVAYVPPSLRHAYISWIENGHSGFGVCDVSAHNLDNGGVVYIGAHA